MSRYFKFVVVVLACVLTAGCLGILSKGPNVSPAPGGGGSSGGGSSAGTADLAVVKQRMEEILNTPSESFDSVLKYFNDPVMISFTLSFDGEEACELAGSDDEDDEPTCMENEPVALEDFVTLEEEDGDISYGGVHYLFIWKVMFPEPEDSEELPDLVKVEIEHSDVVVKADGASIVAAYEMSYTFEITLPDPENPEGLDVTEWSSQIVTLECIWEKIGGEWKITKAKVNLDTSGNAISF